MSADSLMPANNSPMLHRITYHSERCMYTTSLRYMTFLWRLAAVSESRGKHHLLLIVRIQGPKRLNLRYAAVEDSFRAAHGSYEAEASSVMIILLLTVSVECHL
jgi:hypothetical protein